MPKLNETEIELFLAEPGHLIRLSTLDVDGGPRVMPMYFIYEGAKIWVTSREKTVWGNNLRRDPRVGLTIDEEPLPYRKLTVHGTARLVYDLGEDDTWRDQYRRMVRRYLADETADAYVDSTADQPRMLFAVDLEDPANRVESWRMPGADEDISGIWASRYYRPGTEMAMNPTTGHVTWKTVGR